MRNEIDVARENLERSGKTALVNLSEVEVEISFAVKREVNAKGEIKFYVFAVEAGGKYATEQLHKLKLKSATASAEPVAIAE